MSILHIGQVRCSSSHGSMQHLWNSCLNCWRNGEKLIDINIFVECFCVCGLSQHTIINFKFEFEIVLILPAWKYSYDIRYFIWFNANCTTVVVYIAAVFRLNTLRRYFGYNSFSYCTQLTLEKEKKKSLVSIIVFVNLRWFYGIVYFSDGLNLFTWPDKIFCYWNDFVIDLWKKKTSVESNDSSNCHSVSVKIYRFPMLKHAASHKALSIWIWFFATLGSAYQNY